MFERYQMQSILNECTFLGCGGQLPREIAFSYNYVDPCVY